MDKRLRFYIVTVICLMGMFNSAFAQIEHLGRYEMEYEWQFENHMVVSNEERGVTLVRTNRDGSGRTYPVKFTHLNTDLEEVWKDSTRISSKMLLLGYYYQKDKMFVMFQDYPVRKRIKVLSLDYQTQTITSHETTQIAELDLREFEVIQNTAILGGYFEQRPVVFAYDLENDRVKAVQGVYKNNSKLLEVRVNKDSVTFNVLVGELNDEKDQTVIVNTYDYEGNPVREYTLNNKKDYSLIDAVSSSINEVSQVVVGNYGYKSITLPSGIYINYVNRKGEQTMQYINYSELDRFHDYLSKARVDKIKAKAVEVKEKGREQRYKLQALARELVEVDDKLIFQLEFFKPSGNARAISARDINDFNRTNFRRIPGTPDFYDTFGAVNRAPVGDYDFTHSYALVMDKQGKLLWEDSFIMDYTLEGTLDQHGRFQWSDDDGHIVFAHYDSDEEEVFARILDGTGEREVVNAELKILNGYTKRDELRSTVHMTRWYGDLFLAHGVQNIRIDDKSEPADRVFFINALRVNPKSGIPKLD